MSRYFIAALAVLLSFGATALSAETTADPKADLAALDARAEADHELQPLWRSLRDQLSQGNRPTAEQVLQMKGRIRSMMRGGFPINYRLERQIVQAANRARSAAEILSSDLDGDWQITRDELVTSLSGPQLGLRLGRGDAASAFVLGDKDGNDILDTAEIKQAVGSGVSDLTTGIGHSGLPKLFDFDDDGVLTRAEYDRALAALQN